MDIFKHDVYGGPNVGIYAKATDSHVFLPMGFARTKSDRLEEYLGVEALFASVANTRLLGVMMVANNTGLLLPGTASEVEMAFYEKRSGLRVGVLDSKHNALGNMICANDTGAVVSPAMSRQDAEKVADVLDVEVVQRRIAGYRQVGSMMAATNSGAIVHPEADEQDIAKSAAVLGVPVEPATINGGVPFVSSGVLANNRSIVTGSFTTGPEIMMLTRAFSQA